MELMESIWKMAKNDKKKIVLAEGEEKRNLQACDKILKNGLANIVLVGSEEKVRENAKNLGLDISGAEILDPNTSDFTEGYAKEFYELRKKKGMTLEKAEKMVRDPLYCYKNRICRWYGFWCDSYYWRSFKTRFTDCKDCSRSKNCIRIFCYDGTRL